MFSRGAIVSDFFFLSFFLIRVIPVQLFGSSERADGHPTSLASLLPMRLLANSSLAAAAAKIKIEGGEKLLYSTVITGVPGSAFCKFKVA